MTILFFILMWFGDLYVVWKHCGSDIRLLWSTEDLDEVRIEMKKRWKTRNFDHSFVDSWNKQDITRKQIGHRILFNSSLIPCMILAPLAAPVILLKKTYDLSTVENLLYGYKGEDTPNSEEYQAFLTWKQENKGKE